jgi:hypothetical protein
MSRACVTRGSDARQNLSENMKGRDQLRDSGVHERATLNLILRTWTINKCLYEHYIKARIQTVSKIRA